MPPAEAEQLIAVLESPSLRELAARGRVQSFRKDVVIIQEGDYGDTLYILLSGRVKVFATGDNDREVVIDSHGAGPDRASRAAPRRLRHRANSTLGWPT